MFEPNKTWWIWWFCPKLEFDTTEITVQLGFCHENMWLFTPKNGWTTENRWTVTIFATRSYFPNEIFIVSSSLWMIPSTKQQKSCDNQEGMPGSGGRYHSSRLRDEKSEVLWWKRWLNGISMVISWWLYGDLMRFVWWLNGDCSWALPSSKPT